MSEQNNIRLCECGCGNPTSIATKTQNSIGHKKGESVRFIRGHSLKKILGLNIENKNGMWKGDDAKPLSARMRAIRRYPINKTCERCGNKATDRHHKDGNLYNFDKENILMLCRRCHMIKDGRLTMLRDKRNGQFIKKMSQMSGIDVLPSLV